MQSHITFEAIVHFCVLCKYNSRYSKLHVYVIKFLILFMGCSPVSCTFFPQTKLNISFCKCMIALGWYKSHTLKSHGASLTCCTTVQWNKTLLKQTLFSETIFVCQNMYGHCFASHAYTLCPMTVSKKRLLSMRKCLGLLLFAHLGEYKNIH